MNRYDPQARYSAFDCLHPVAFLAFSNLDALLQRGFKAGDTKTEFRAFETYRHPLRQRMLMGKGGVTKAKEYQSAHQFGLAVDFVPWQGGWTWDGPHDWEYLRASARHCGLLVPYNWDKAHVEHPKFEFFRHEVNAIYR